MDDDRPLVTVVIPTRDRLDLLRRALASVLAQTFTDLECVVVDDGSTDGTTRAVRALGEPRVTTIRLPVGRGAPRARNVAIRSGQGRYVAFLDDDDEWLPHHLARHMELLTGTPRLVAAYSGVWIDRNGRRTQHLADTDGGRFERLLAFAWPITTSGIVIDRAAAGDELRFDESLPAMQELELLIRLARIGDVGCVPEPTYCWHWHGGPRIQSNTRHVAARTALLDKLAGDLEARPAVAAYHHYRLAVSQRRTGDFRGSARSLVAAARLDRPNARYRFLASCARLGPFATRLAWRGAHSWDRLRGRDPDGPLGGEAWIPRITAASSSGPPGTPVTSDHTDALLSVGRVEG